MASLDVDSLFSNVLLNDTIEICVNELFKSSQTASILVFSFKIFFLKIFKYWMDAKSRVLIYLH